MTTEHGTRPVSPTRQEGALPLVPAEQVTRPVLPPGQQGASPLARSEQGTRSAFGFGLRLSGHGLVLREWTDDDLPVMVELFDDREVAYWTPLVTPFDLGAARNYLDKARRTRAIDQRVHLAITTDGGRAKGEALLIMRDDGTGSIGYAVGAAYRGQRLAVRAVQVMTDFAHEVAGLAQVFLEIEPDNEPSTRVARAAGFHLSDAPPNTVEDKGRTLSLLTWTHFR
jgi:RimJ/RimL family protein N-acetyltransferase